MENPAALEVSAVSIHASPGPPIYRVLIARPCVCVCACQAYVRSSKSRELLKWWAQYKESQHDMDEALRFYGAADDILSLVRVYCFQVGWLMQGEREGGGTTPCCAGLLTRARMLQEDTEKAHERVKRTQNKAAAYHLARHFEAKVCAGGVGGEGWGGGCFAGTGGADVLGVVLLLSFFRIRWSKRLSCIPCRSATPMPFG
jgi:hypothetical protein